MESLKTLISNVLDNSESLCLDSSEDKNTLLDSIMDALVSEGADVQVDNDGQLVVYTGVYEVKECYYCGDNCPNEPNDSEYMCDGFAGDIDGLYTEEA